MALNLPQEFFSLYMHESGFFVCSFSGMVLEMASLPPPLFDDFHFQPDEPPNGKRSLIGEKKIPI